MTIDEFIDSNIDTIMNSITLKNTLDDSTFEHLKSNIIIFINNIINLVDIDEREDFINNIHLPILINHINGMLIKIGI